MATIKTTPQTIPAVLPALLLLPPLLLLFGSLFPLLLFVDDSSTVLSWLAADELTGGGIGVLGSIIGVSSFSVDEDVELELVVSSDGDDEDEEELVVSSDSITYG